MVGGGLAWGDLQTLGAVSDSASPYRARDLVLANVMRYSSYSSLASIKLSLSHTRVCSLFLVRSLSLSRTSTRTVRRPPTRRVRYRPYSLQLLLSSALSFSFVLPLSPSFSRARPCSLFLSLLPGRCRRCTRSRCSPSRPATSPAPAPPQPPPPSAQADQRGQQRAHVQTLPFSFS